ncbi:MAG: GTPase Era [Acutalibacteraceae bacterium]|nr:GTPase Era [Acutalibacteraceae bacterium]
MAQKTAFIAIVGRPNVGKSSILNKILGQKITIVSSKPQTTRTRIMGVYTKDDIQLVFIDTPGLHKPRNSLGKYMVRSINESVAGVDACLLAAESEKAPGDTEKVLMQRFDSLGIPAVLALNKIDKLKEKSEIISTISSYGSEFDFDDIVPVSAHTGEGIDELITALSKQASEGEHMFDPDTITDQPERVIAGEIIREKILRLTDKEIPHGTAVVIERFKPRSEGGITDIDATIYCERAAHKGILIGKGGSMLKKIGSYARHDMESFFDCKVNLTLWVKVKEDWRNREGILRSLGYDQNNFD